MKLSDRHAALIRKKRVVIWMYDFCNYNPKFVKSGENYKTRLGPKSEHSFDLQSFTPITSQNNTKQSFSSKLELAGNPIRDHQIQEAFFRAIQSQNFVCLRVNTNLKYTKTVKKKTTHNTVPIKKINISFEIVHGSVQILQFYGDLPYRN